MGLEGEIIDSCGRGALVTRIRLFHKIPVKGHKECNYKVIQDNS